MAIKIKPIDTIVKKFIARGGAAGADYANGIANAKSWQAGASAGAQNWATGVQTAASSGMFAKGVAKAGDAKWQRKSSGVGATRFGPGIQAAGPDYATGFQPFADALAAVNLPPRGPKGDPNNAARVNAVMQAMRARKLQG